MDSKRFQQLNAWFDRLLPMSESEREAAFEEIAPDLRSELRDLLGLHSEPDGVLGDSFLDAGKNLIDEVARELSDRPRNADFVIPAKIDRFTVDGEIGRGGVGVVLAARDETIGREVAIKVLLDPQAREQAVARFLDEGQISGQLQHPSIVPIHELGRTEEGHPYIVMKRIDGETLEALLQDRAAAAEDRPRLLQIFEQVCEGVAFAHSKQVTHRDLKPSNLMIGAFGEVQVMDWGLAKLLSDETDSELPPVDRTSKHRSESSELRIQRGESHRSIAGTIVGTPAYMSPEQARGDRDRIDARTDVFALGAILCQMLLARGPYRGGTTEQVLSAARRGDLEVGPQLEGLAASDPMAQLALDCLEEDPANRPADAGALASRVREHRHSLEARAQAAALEAAEARVRAQGERRARRLVSAIAILVVLSLGGGGWVVIERELEEQRRIAQIEQDLGRALARTERLAAESEASGVRALEKWSLAQSAVNQAKDLLRPEVSTDLRTEAEQLFERVRSGAAISQLVTDLDRSRDAAARLDAGSFGHALENGYRRTFRDAVGQSFTALSEDRAVEWIERSGAPNEIREAIDLWARAIQQIEGTASLDFRFLLRVASRVDPDPWRMELRAAAMAKDEARLQALVDRPGFDEQPAYSLYLLGIYLYATVLSHDAGIEVLEKAQYLFPQDFTINNDLAMMSRDPRNALRYSTAAVVINDSSAEAHGRLAIRLAEVKDDEAAERHIQRALEIAPNSGHVHTNLGYMRKSRGEFSESLEHYRRALELKQEQEGATIYDAWALGEMLVFMEQYEEGREVLERGKVFQEKLPHATSPSFMGRYYNGLGNAYISTGSPEKAALAFAKAVEATPEVFLYQKNAGWALQELGRFAEAIEPLRKALALKPNSGLVYRHLAQSYLALEDYGEAVQMIRAICEGQPGFRFGYELARDLLRAPLTAEQQLELIAALDRTVTLADEAVDPIARIVYLQWWIRRPEPSFAPRIRAVTERVRDEFRNDPEVLTTIARVHIELGDLSQAIATLERANRFVPAPAPWAPALDRLRAQALPQLPTHQTIDATIDRRDSADLIAMLEAFRKIAQTPEERRRVRYFAARLRALGGEEEAAIRDLETLLAEDREIGELYGALWSLLSPLGPAGEARFSAALSAGPLPPDPLPLPPSPPALLPPEISSSTDPVHLRIEPARHRDPRVAVVATRWEVRADSGEFDRTPTLDVWQTGAESTHEVPSGLLLPRTSYHWRVTQRLSDGSQIASRVLQFRTPKLPIELIAIDLSEHFNADVVLNPGDDEEGSFDRGGHSFVEDGFDPAGESLDVRGFPISGQVGVHQLADYTGLHVIQRSPTEQEDLTLTVPPGRYVALRFLVSGANGESTLPVTLTFLDGTTQEAIIPAPDWFDDPEPDSAGATPVLNQLDRAIDSRISDRGDPALFEVLLSVSEGSPLIGLDLRFSRAEFPAPESRFHCFSITGIRAVHSEF